MGVSMSCNCEQPIQAKPPLNLQQGVAEETSHYV